MGLDFSHGGAHWAYSGFMRFRKRLAAVYGVELSKMEGFQMDWEPKISNPIPWTKTTCGELTALINHSDCDGYLRDYQCKKMAPALRKAVESWPNGDYDKEQALLLADGMERAAKEKKRLRFF